MGRGLAGGRPSSAAFGCSDQTPEMGGGRRRRATLAQCQRVPLADLPGPDNVLPARNGVGVGNWRLAHAQPPASPCPPSARPLTARRRPTHRRREARARGALRKPHLPADRARGGRPRIPGRRGARRRAHVLGRVRSGRRVEVERRWPPVGSGVRRAAGVVHRLRRCRPVRSQRRLGGLRRGQHPRQRRRGRRDLPFHRWRRDVVALMDRGGADRDHRRAPARRGRRIRRRPGQPVRPSDPSAGCTGRPTAGRPGSGCCSSIATPAPRTSASTPRTRTSCSPGRGRRGARPGASPAAVRAAACTCPATAAAPGSACRGMRLPEGIWGKVGVRVAPTDGRRVYALIEADKGGLFRSDDGGSTWALVNPSRGLRQRAWYYTTPDRRTPQPGRRLVPRGRPAQDHRRRRHHALREGRRMGLPRPVDRPLGTDTDHRRQRRRRVPDLRRR